MDAVSGTQWHVGKQVLGEGEARGKEEHQVGMHVGTWEVGHTQARGMEGSPLPSLAPWTVLAAASPGRCSPSHPTAGKALRNAVPTSLPSLTVALCLLSVCPASPDAELPHILRTVVTVDG